MFISGLKEAIFVILGIHLKSAHTYLMPAIGYFMQCFKNRYCTLASVGDRPAHLLTFSVRPLWQALFVVYSRSSFLFLITPLRFLPPPSLCLLCCGPLALPCCHLSLQLAPVERTGPLTPPLGKAQGNKGEKENHRRLFRKSRGKKILLQRTEMEDTAIWDFLTFGSFSTINKTHI